MSDTFWEFPYPSQRMPVLAENVVATSQPLAAQAGVEMLRRGGNAVDAAVAAAAALTVVEPTSNGIGGDAFALVWDGRALHGLNASGRSPAALDADRLLGLDTMPTRGWDAVTVPGAPSAWVALNARFGSLGLDEVLEPAARYAEHGWPVGPITARAWAAAAPSLGGSPTFAAAFLPGGTVPRAGDRFRFPDQARTLRAIGATGARAFYEGEVAERICTAAAADGAALAGEDLRGHRPEWVEPLRMQAFGVEVAELPPNGQGAAALGALGIMARTPAAGRHPGDPVSVHHQVEAMKAAFADLHAEVADPDWMRVDPHDLYGDRRLEAHASAIDPDAASDPRPFEPPRGGTVYLAAADADGLMVSFIQSNYMGFGSGIVVPGTGVSLQNRGACFSTVAGHPNAVAGGKRPLHTIIPAFALRDGDPYLAFGVMGGHMQPQGHLQMILRTCVGGENPQAAADAPRWRYDGGRAVAVEAGVDQAVVEYLRDRGHVVSQAAPSDLSHMFGFGGAQLVQRLPGGWLAASDHRKEGQAAGF
jgi:gamma-glutamyltranspeptidase / glutathione hydrolase